jgi:solute carrier family 35 protein E3
MTPAQGWTLMLLGPFLDRYVSAAWVFNYDWNVPALTCLALSCACAVGVNISQFMCLGRFSAVSYQARATLPGHCSFAVA